MRSRHRVALTWIAAVIVAVAAGLAPPSAAARPSSDDARTANQVQDPDAVIAYWDRARMQAAEPYNRNVGTPAGQALPVAPTTLSGEIGASTAARSPSSGRPRTLRRCVTRRGVRRCSFYRAGTTRPSRVCVTRSRRTKCRAVRASQALGAWGFSPRPLASVGKIYFTDAYTLKPNVCSGTLITEDTVLTAAHCVYSKRRSYINGNIMFAPGHTGELLTDGSYRGAFPYGRYSVDRVAYLQLYLDTPDDAGDTPVDYALMHLSTPASGVGTFSANYGVGLAYGESLFRYGYPAEGAWRYASGGNGNFQVQCETTYDDYWTVYSGYYITMDCPANGGSSGGPVFKRLSDGSWGIVGVMSRCRRDTSVNQHCQTNLVPWLDDEFGVLWSFYLQGGGAVPFAGAG